MQLGECTRAWLNKGAVEGEPHFSLELQLCLHPPLLLRRDPLPAPPLPWILAEISCSFFHLCQGRALHFSVRKELSSLGLTLGMDECPFLSLPGQCWGQQQQRRDAPVKEYRTEMDSDVSGV